MGVVFVDELGQPMAAGVQVSVFTGTASQTTDTLLASDWTQPGGLCPNIPVLAGQAYTATFVGRQAPNTPQAFIAISATNTPATVAPYRSPSMNGDGYAQFSTQVLWPKSDAWWGDDARAPGGVAWAIARSIGEIDAWLDAQAQVQLARARIQSSVGIDVDSWVRDFLGQFAPRYDGDTDETYKQRVYALLSLDKTTRAAIKFMVNAFYTIVALEAASTSATLTFDSGTGSFDQGLGAFDLPASPGAIIPTIDAWDRQWRPDLADKFGINPNNDDGSFVIQLGFAPTVTNAWYLNHGYLNFDSYLIGTGEWEQSFTSPDPRLDALIDFMKAIGTTPIYLTAITTP